MITPPPGATRLDQLPAAVLDLETTGLKPRGGDSIVEVGIVQVDGFRIREEGCLSHLIDPGCEVSRSAFRVHGIADEELHGQPAFAAVLPRLLGVLDGRVMVGHNPGFDLGFLREEMERLQRTAPLLTTIDTVLLARSAFPDHGGGYGLDEVAALLGLDTAGFERHRALDDARLTAQAYVQLAQRLPDRIESLFDLQRWSTDTAVSAGRYKGVVRSHTVPTLDDAVRAGMAVSMVYLSHGRDRTVRVVEPIALRGLWVDAFCRLRSAPRSFRLDRIVECALAPGAQGTTP